MVNESTYCWIAKLSAGSIALLSHVDVDTAANSAQTAVENNAIWAAIPAIIWVADKAWTAYQVYQDIQALQNGTKTWEQLAREKGTEYMAQAILSNVAKFGLKAVKSGSGYALRKVAQTCSFRGDMLIKTVSGYKTIDSISIGDQVLSRNEQTGAVSFQTVLNQYNNAYKQTVYIDIVDADGNKQTIVSNTIHPFFVKIDHNTPVPPSSEGHHYKGEIENAHWVDASNLKAGYKLLCENGQWQIVQNIKVTDEPLSAYNLTVNNDHTYFVTSSGTTYGVWVHNSCFVKPSSNLKVGDRIDISSFKESRFNGQKVYKYGNYMIVKDRRAGTSSAHGGSFWKLLDKKGNRIGTLSEDGRYLRR
ncbi:polymorphic toxin-type HINT domain-containing protein [Psychrobacter lutiphocae]|uniref:polymorphic toxin-type HINT domain-containing protein n=1 Tax=Psychrobacter lutiphocae TaxID=540500 RepID=UPI000369E3E5|nr:polymorphic toxin-type HINT domain-containing protein [Psychrobacter lutiphocae]